MSGRLPGAVEDRMEHLYGLPLAEFTGERNELARRLRAEGQHEAADRVKRLKKPSEPAWAVNQLARRHKRELGALLRAGERLRAAQESALGGGGQRVLRSAIAEEREQVGKLVGLAEPLLGARSEAKLERVRATLHAAAIDDELRERLTSGRLVEDRAAAGLGPLGGVPAPAATDEDRAERKAAAAAAKEREAARRQAEKARREVERKRARVTAAAAELEAAERRLAEAETRERDAR